MSRATALLLLLTASFGSSLASAQERPDRTDDSPPAGLLLLPGGASDTLDQRTLADRRNRFIGRALELEQRARQADEGTAPGEGDAEQDAEQRLEQLRIAGLVLSAPPAPATISQRTLTPFDHYLYLFARDHLAIDPYDVQAFQEWIEANERFLDQGDPEARNEAIQMRDRALESWQAGLVLCQVIHALDRGPLSAAERKRLIGLLDARYPGRDFAAVSVMRSSDSLGGDSAGFTSDPTLPRLDGAEHPSRIIENLNRLAEEIGARGG